MVSTHLVARIRGPMKRLLGVVGALADRAPGIGPHVIRGRQLDPEVRALLLAKRWLRFPHPAAASSVADARRTFDDQFKLVDGPAGLVGSVVEERWDLAQSSIAVRLYRPVGFVPPGPLMIWFHGGGFVVGNLESHDAACRRLCQATGALVLAADYRLAPEHPFPAAWEDALAIFDAAQERAESLGVDPTRIAVGGDSAGGNLAAGVSLARRGPAFQVLLYPGVDWTWSFESHRVFGEGYLLDKRLIDWFAGHAVPPGQRRDPRASPWFATDLAGQAPAIIVTAGFDPLCDEAEAYATRLQEAGIRVDHRREDALPHGYITMTGALSAGAQAMDRLHDDIRNAFQRPAR